MAKSKTRKIRIHHFANYCSHCEDSTTFVIDKVHTLPDEGPPEEYTFAHCEVCNYPAIFFREDMGDGFDQDAYYRMFPSQDRHIGYFLPPVIRDSYEEAVQCEKSKTAIAALTMVGRTLEAICKEFDPNTKSIYDGLKSLQSKGIISQELLDWANALRALRNTAAHATTMKIEMQDATDSLDFLQAILEILFELRPRFEKFQKRKKKP